MLKKIPYFQCLITGLIVSVLSFLPLSLYAGVRRKKEAKTNNGPESLCGAHLLLPIRCSFIMYLTVMLSSMTIQERLLIVCSHVIARLLTIYEQIPSLSSQTKCKQIPWCGEGTFKCTAQVIAGAYNVVSRLHLAHSPETSRWRKQSKEVFSSFSRVERTLRWLELPQCQRRPVWRTYQVDSALL